MAAMQAPQSIPAKLFLLCYQPTRERLSGGFGLAYALRTAALAELYLGGNLSINERGRATAHGSVDDPVLAAVLAEVSQQPLRKLDRYIYLRPREFWRQLSTQLVTGGLIQTERRRLLGIFPQTKITVLDPLVIDRLRQEFDATLREQTPAERVEPHAAALVAIAAAAELNIVIGRKQRRASRERIQQFAARIDPLIRALRRVIETMQASVAASG
jgi:hypothetical protein